MIEERVMQLEHEFEEGKVLIQEVNEVRARHVLYLGYECCFWHQKARVKGLEDGDHNTRFFISVLKPDGHVSVFIVLRIHLGIG